MKSLTYKFELLGESWELDFHAITVDDAIEVRKLTGLKWLELISDFDQRDALAIKSLLYLARKKSGEKIRFADIAFTMTGIQVSTVTPVLEEQDGDGGQVPEPGGDEDPDPTEQARKPRARRKTSST